jgi:pimeloyl-ACP methyl ester carboxylesterase
MKPLVLTLALALALPALAADARAETAAVVANRFAASIIPAERFEVGVLAVERHGSGGVPMILVPGLSSGAWAWQDFVRRDKGEHTIYVVTLPGFDGRAAVTGPVFEQARSALRQLIVSRALSRPVIVGHNVGATLAIALAETDSTLLRAVVAIDGLPVMPGSEQTPPAMRSQMAAAIKARMGGPGLEPAAFAASQRQYMRGIGVLDLPMADELAKLSARSDPRAVLDIMGEVLEQDLRAGLPKIGVPVLLIAPFFEADAVQRGLTREMVKGYYASLMAGTPALTVTTIAPARHFVMFDQPAELAQAIGQFVAPLR